jgi:hypothetical protein
MLQVSQATGIMMICNHYHNTGSTVAELLEL